MRKFHIKSVILGMGIGIILASLSCMIYISSVNPMHLLRKDQVITLAKQYGMVEDTSALSSILHLLQQNNAATSNPKENTIQSQPSSEQKAQMLSEPKYEDVTLIIRSGDSSEVVADTLIMLELISDKALFQKKMEEAGLSSRIKIGKFNIRKGTDITQILETITTP